MIAFLLFCACCGIGFIIRELLRQREVLDTVRWQNVARIKLEREDAANELNYWHEKEWTAINYIRQEMPNFRADFVWGGWKSADELSIDEDNPKNLFWRKRVEELRKSVPPLETVVSEMRGQKTAEGIAELTKLVQQSFRKPTDGPKGNP
jgi:hypothetical protein